MASPPIVLDPYIVESLMPDLVGHDRRPAAFVVYLALWFRARGGGPVAMSHQSLAAVTGLSRSAVQASVARLVKRGLITAARAHATAVPRYTVLQPWARRVRA